TKCTTLLDQKIQSWFAGGCIGISWIESALSTATADLIQKEQKARSVSTGGAALFTHPGVDGKGKLSNDEALILEIGDVREIDNTNLCFAIDTAGAHKLVDAHLFAADPVGCRADELSVYGLCKLLTPVFGNMVVNRQHTNRGKGRFQYH